MNKALSWTLRIIPAVLIGQTLPFKFTGRAESVTLFTDLTTAALRNPGLEATARVGTGVMELIAIVLLLIPKFSIKGAFLVVALMVGALMSHVAFIGFAGYEALSGMALVSLVCAAAYLVKNWKSINLPTGLAA